MPEVISTEKTSSPQLAILVENLERGQRSNIIVETLNKKPRPIYLMENRVDYKCNFPILLASNLERRRTPFILFDPLLLKYFPWIKTSDFIHYVDDISEYVPNINKVFASKYYALTKQSSEVGKELNWVDDYNFNEIEEIYYATTKKD